MCLSYFSALCTGKCPHSIGNIRIISICFYVYLSTTASTLYVMLQIFDKAVDEPKFSSLYAQLCERLSKDAPNFEPPQRKINVSSW